MRVLCGIVLYNPNIDRLKENLIGIYKQVDHIVLINNNSNNIDDILLLISGFLKEKKLPDTFINLINNKSNEGIAFALNEILDFAFKNKYEWFISLDQDSVAYEHLIVEYLKYTDLSNIAMMSCVIKDRNFDEKNLLKKDFAYVKFCITSGAFNNTKVLKELGGFDNSLFIDSVDYDICATIVENNYNIIKVNYEGLLHEVGHARIVRPFFRREQVYNHSSFRVYYIIRNSIILMKKHKSLNTIKNKIKLIKRKFLILRYYDNKEENKTMIKKAVCDARKIIKEKYRGE